MRRHNTRCPRVRQRQKDTFPRELRSRQNPPFAPMLSVLSSTVARSPVTVSSRKQRTARCCVAPALPRKHLSASRAASFGGDSQAALSIRFEISAEYFPPQQNYPLARQSDFQVCTCIPGS